MKERPILFSTEMVNAILTGCKTQTRRIINPKPDAWVPSVGRLPYKTTNKKPSKNASIWQEDDGTNYELIKCPFGLPGDVLWVREQFTWEHRFPNSTGENFKITAPVYRADKQPHVAKLMKWKPSIHMPKDIARIWLKITDIRVERLQDITDEGALEEGCLISRNSFITGELAYAFRLLWERINGKGSWLVNPWVWVVEFEKIEKL